MMVMNVGFPSPFVVNLKFRCRPARLRNLKSLPFLEPTHQLYSGTPN
jgi:hypothetical protein